MNGAHLHLALNHAPVIGAFVVSAVFVVALVRRSREIAWLGYWGQIAVGVAAIVVYLSGNAAESVVARLPGVDRALIGHHQVIAVVAMIVAVLAALAAAVPLTLDLTANRAVLIGFLVFSLIVDVAFAITATAGGAIRHPEIAR